MWASGVKASSGATGFDSKVRVRLSANQVITNLTWTLIAWAVAEYDGLSEFDAGNNRIVVDANGYYDLKYCLQASNIFTAKQCQCRLQIDGVDAAGSSGMVGEATFPYTKFCGGISGYLAAGAVITMDFHHSYGANRSLIAVSAGGCRLSMERFA